MLSHLCGIPRLCIHRLVRFVVANINILEVPTIPSVGCVFLMQLPLPSIVSFLIDIEPVIVKVATLTFVAWHIGS